MVGVCVSRPEVFGGKRFLLKSIQYAATHRGDMFTLPCEPQVLSSRILLSLVRLSASDMCRTSPFTYLVFVCVKLSCLMGQNFGMAAHCMSVM